MTVKLYKRALKNELKAVIKGCKETLKESISAHEHANAIDLESKIYAYEFVLKDMIDTVVMPEK